MGDPPQMGRLGEYTGLQDKDGTPILIGQVIRMEGIEKADGGYSFGRVWFHSPELAARRVDEKTGELLPGSYSLVDWGYGRRVPEFTVVDPHPGARWSSEKEES